jgi:DNA-directed RNA polymerase specialized sigma24 family protein
MNDNNQQNCIERAQQGDPAAIAELYKYYWRAARAAAYGVTADINIAEDAASEAFYAALSSLQDLKDTQRFGPWLRTIVVRIA